MGDVLKDKQLKKQVLALFSDQALPRRLYIHQLSKVVWWAQ